MSLRSGPALTVLTSRAGGGDAEVSAELLAGADASGLAGGDSAAPGAAESPPASPDASPLGNTPADTSASPPPALDISTISAGPDLSDISLTPEISKAATPALAASLRFTEEARRQLAERKTDEAIRTLARAVSIDPGNPFEYFLLGRSYVAKGNCQQAMTFFKRAEIGFASRPDWLAETLSREGSCYEEAGQLSAAAKAYSQALSAAPNNVMARVGYGRVAASVPASGNVDASAPNVDSAPPPPPAEAPPQPAD
jgi:Flp pilus assembly protein TadD